MRKRRIAGVVLLTILLVASVAAGNAAVAAERTVLSDEYMKAALAEEEAYAIGETVVTEQLASGGGDGGGLAGGDGSSLPIDRESLLEDAVTRPYVRSQAERNIDRLYTYLHGGRESVAVVVDLTPVRSNLADGIEAQLSEAALSALLAPAAGEGGTVPLGGVVVEPALFDDLAADESSYRAARADFRERVRAAVLERAVQRAIESSSDDELLALVIEGYDPDEYTEAEKSAMVADREGEIETAVRQQIEAERGDEIDRTVEDQLDSLPETVRQEAGSAETPDGIPQAVGEAYADLLVVGVQGLTAEMSYDTYSDRLTERKAAFAAAFGDTMEARLAEEMPGQTTVIDSEDAQGGQMLADARQAVGIVDALSIALPLLAVVLVGLLWWLTRSPAVTAAATGVALLVGGLPGVAVMALLPSRAAALLGGGMPPQLRSIAIGLIERTARTVGVQSGALVALGAVLLLLAVYLRAYGTPAWLAGRLTRG